MFILTVPEKVRPLAINRLYLYDFPSDSFPDLARATVASHLDISAYQGFVSYNLRLLPFPEFPWKQLCGCTSAQSPALVPWHSRLRSLGNWS